MGKFFITILIKKIITKILFKRLPPNILGFNNLKILKKLQTDLKDFTK